MHIHWLALDTHASRDSCGFTVLTYHVSLGKSQNNYLASLKPAKAYLHNYSWTNRRCISSRLPQRTQYLTRNEVGVCVCVCLSSKDIAWQRNEVLVVVSYNALKILCSQTWNISFTVSQGDTVPGKILNRSTINPEMCFICSPNKVWTSWTVDSKLFNRLLNPGKVYLHLLLRQVSRQELICSPM